MAKANPTSPAPDREAVIQELLQAVILLDNTMRYSSMAHAYQGSAAQQQVQMAMKNASSIRFPSNV
jgi:hypothetical protein